MPLTQYDQFNCYVQRFRVRDPLLNTRIACSYCRMQAGSLALIGESGRPYAVFSICMRCLPRPMFVLALYDFTEQTDDAVHHPCAE